MKPRRLHEMYYETFAQLGEYGSFEQPQSIDLDKLGPCDLLPADAAVYMLSFSFDTLAYVGQTTNLRQRFLAHHRMPTFRSLHAATLASGLLSYRRIDPAHLQALETALIEHGKPPLNNVPVQAPPVFVGTWIPQALWEQLSAYAYGYGVATGTQYDIPTCVASILADYFKRSSDSSGLSYPLLHHQQGL